MDSRTEKSCRTTQRWPSLRYPRFGFQLSILLVVTLAIGCQKSDERVVTKQLVGTWQLASPDHLADRMNKDDKDNPVPDRFSGDAMGIVVAFEKSGKLQTTTSVLGEDVIKVGTWKVLNVDRTSNKETSANIEFKLGEDDPQAIQVTIINESKIRMVPPNIAVLEKEYEFERSQ